MFYPEGDGRQRWGGLGQIFATDSGRLEAELEGVTLETNKEAAAGAEREEEEAWSGEAMESIPEMFRICGVKFPVAD